MVVSKQGLNFVGGFVIKGAFSIIAVRNQELWVKETKKQRRERFGRAHTAIPENARLKLPMCHQIK